MIKLVNLDSFLGTHYINKGLIWIRLILFGIIALFPLLSSAEVLIITIDPDFIIHNSQAFIAAQKQIEEKNLEYKNLTLSNKNELQQDYQALQRDRHQISEIEFENKNKKIADKAKQYYDDAYAKKILLQEATENVNNYITKELEKIIKEYVKEYNGNVTIFNRNNIIFIQEKFDKTDYFLQKLNVKLPYFKLSF